MTFYGIRGWWLVLGLVLVGTGGTGCVGESPCEYTATCPPPEGGPGDSTSSDDLSSLETDDAELTESTNTDAPEKNEDPKPIPTISFPTLPVLPVTPESPADAGYEGGNFDADVSSDRDVEADASAPEVSESDLDEAEETEPMMIDTENTENVDPGASELGETEPAEVPDYCADDNGGCDSLTACSSTPSGADCGVCPAGYVGSGSSGCAPGLLGLSLSHGTTSPAIDAGVDTYQAVVPVFIQNLTLTPSAPAEATLSIRGGLVAPGATWTSPPLDLGLNAITILVEQTGRPSSTYTLNVTRGADATVYVKSSNAAAGDRFGNAVALSGDGSTLAVGARFEDSDARGVDGPQDNDAASNSGAVYVFARNGNGWAQQAYVKASNTGAGDYFGAAVALSSDGNTLAVGAYWEDSSATGVGGDENNDGAPSSGAVYVFARSGTSWAQQAYVKASNTEVGDNFGWAVSLSGDGNTLAVGASVKYLDEDNSPGAAYVFTRSGSAWTQRAFIGAPKPEETSEFGYAVALSHDGSTLAVGAPREIPSGGGEGAAYVFMRNGNNWTQQAHYFNVEAHGRFGIAVALAGDGHTLAVGAYLEDGNAGAVYVFARSGSAWTQQARVKASNADAQDLFGGAVSLSINGNTLAVGAPGEDSGSIEAIGGDQSNNSVSSAGAAYVFARRGGRGHNRRISRLSMLNPIPTSAHRSPCRATVPCWRWVRPVIAATPAA